MLATASFIAFAAAGLAQAAKSGVNEGEPAFTGELLIQPGVSSAFCLAAESNENGAAVVMKSCTGKEAQKWTFDEGTIKVFGDKCMDVVDGSTANGTKLQIYTCDKSNPNQQFYYTPWGDNHIQWKNKGKCLDLTDASTADGNRPQLWDCAQDNQVWNVGYMANDLPDTTAPGQSGVNNCGTENSDSATCQTIWLNSAEDFCLWGPAEVGPVGETEAHVVSYCTKEGRGTRTIPKGAITGAHFVKTPDFVQITGVGDMTPLNVPKGDDGGELDPHGAEGTGNPIGGLVYGNSFGEALQYHEWTSFISEKEYCFRACTGNQARELCQHIYDVMGCYWNMPANYDEGVFENCEGDSGEPMGVYGTSTWHQDVKPTPEAHPQPSSSNCENVPSITPSPMKHKRSHGFDRVARAPVPGHKF